MTTFLRNFFSEEILSQPDETIVVRQATEKAIEIAMMGLSNEAREILDLLELSDINHKETKRSLRSMSSPSLEFFLAESSSDGSGVDDLNEGRLLELVLEAKDALPHLPKEIQVKDGGEESYSTLKEFAKEMEKSKFSRAATGYDSMRLSSALAGLLFMAKDLGHEEDIPDLMKQTANRIHANQQARYLASVRCIWKDHLLSGWLREQLGVSFDSMKQYAGFVLSVTKKRLEQGTQTANALYADYSIKDLLKELENNTISSPGFQNGDYAPYPTDQYGEIPSILLPPATREEMSETVTRIGHPLPTDLQNFLKISNGTLRVKSGPLPMFQLRLPPLKDITWEEDDFMLDYQFILLPDIDLGIEVEWPGIECGGIAFYEHDGQGTQYVWFLTEALVEKAKGILQEVYNEQADGTQRKKIDDAIERVYGSRKAYDEMKRCLYLQSWGEPSGQKIWVDFREYLRWVVLESRNMEERSPLKVPEDML